MSWFSKPKPPQDPQVLIQTAAAFFNSALTTDTAHEQLSLLGNAAQAISEATRLNPSLPVTVTFDGEPRTFTQDAFSGILLTLQAEIHFKHYMANCDRYIKALEEKNLTLANSYEPSYKQSRKTDLVYALDAIQKAYKYTQDETATALRVRIMQKADISRKEFENALRDARSTYPNNPDILQVQFSYEKAK